MNELVERIHRDVVFRQTPWNIHRPAQPIIEQVDHARDPDLRQVFELFEDLVALGPHGEVFQRQVECL